MIPNFIRGLELSDEVSVIGVLSECDDFAVLKLNNNRTGLFLDGTVYRGLNYFIKEKEFLQECFTEYENGYYFVSKPDYKVYSAIQGPFAETEAEVSEFCSAYSWFIDEYREASVSDIVFVEEYDIILPIEASGDNALSPYRIIGSWLTDGLPVDAFDFDKVCLLNLWLSSEFIADMISEAGLRIKGNTMQETAILEDKLEDEPEDESEDKLEDKPVKRNVHYHSIGKFELPGREELSKYFNDEIIDFYRKSDKYEDMGIHSAPSTLLYGKPGCGKTYAVKQLADFLGFPCFEINSSSVGSPYIHETGKKVSEIFSKAIDKAPSVLIIDEMESYLSTRDNSGNGTYHIEEVDEFLRNIPKALDAQVILFGMTNMIDLIDPAIVRKGRFDRIIEVGMPSKQEILSVFISGMEKIPFESDIDFDLIAEKLLGRPLSDVSYVIKQAARLTVKNDLEVVKQEYLLEAVNDLGKTEKAPEDRKIGFI